MAAITRKVLEDLRLCAQLADYAYVSGKPGDNTVELAEKWPTGYRRTDIGRNGRDKFYSNSWYRKRGTQHRFFKSHAYVCSLEKADPVAAAQDPYRIVVGFRGTWNHPGEANEGVAVQESTTGGTPSVSGLLSRIYNLPFSLLAPSNYGLADVYYDLTLIRVPYRTGVVWKWYTYWGTVILGGSDWFRCCFGPSRKMAAGLITQPAEPYIADHGNLLVHLGFWALWASAEGFSGYDCFGNLRKDEKIGGKDVSQGVLQSVVKQVRLAEEGCDVEILVVGHSLGGSVSCYAALDIITEMVRMAAKGEKAFKKVKVIHATFGAPPVGTPAFAAHFAERTVSHKSYAVIHERDLVPKCFAWCQSDFPRKHWYSPVLRFLRWLGWWSDWSRVGKELVLWKEVEIDLASQEKSPPSEAVPFVDKAKVGLLGVGAIGFIVLSHLAVPLSVFALPYFLLEDMIKRKKYYSRQKNPAGDWKINAIGNNTPSAEQRKAEDKKLEHAGLEYHKIKNYIKLLNHPDPFRVNGAGAMGSQNDREEGPALASA